MAEYILPLYDATKMFDLPKFHIMIEAMKKSSKKNIIFSISLMVIASLWVVFTFLTNKEISEDIFEAPQKRISRPRFHLE